MQHYLLEPLGDGGLSLLQRARDVALNREILVDDGRVLGTNIIYMMHERANEL